MVAVVAMSWISEGRSAGQKAPPAKSGMGWFIPLVREVVVDVVLAWRRIRRYSSRLCHRYWIGSRGVPGSSVHVVPSTRLE